MLQLAEGLEGHEFVVRLRRPCVNLDGVAQRDDEELDSLVLDDLEVDRALEVADVDPSGAPLDGVVRPQNLRLEPREVVDPHSVLLACIQLKIRYILLKLIFDHPLTRNGDEDVLPLEDLHLLEAPPGDELVDLALAAPVQQHEAVLRPDEEVDAPERGAQDLGVEALLVFPGKMNPYNKPA